MDQHDFVALVSDWAKDEGVNEVLYLDIDCSFGNLLGEYTRPNGDTAQSILKKKVIKHFFKDGVVPLWTQKLNENTTVKELYEMLEGM